MLLFFFFSSRRRHTRWTGDWSSDVCSSDLLRDGDRESRRRSDGNSTVDSLRSSVPRAMEIDAELRGQSPALAAVREQVKGLLQRVASGRLPAILIEGETGTGKGLLARTLHRGGPRAGRPFVDVNCAAIPESLLESELFGHEKGAFTDARQAKAGLFQAAHGGTLFLDEVGLLPVGLQGKLLKAVEAPPVRRLGGTRNEPIDVWMISATSEDLRAALRGGRMREDLY